MSQVQGTDAQLIKIYEEKGISDAFWPKHKILGTKKIENPFFDINSKTAAGKEALKEHPSITLLCDECLVYDVDPSNITIDKEYSNHRNLLFRSEIQGNGKEAPIEKDPTFLATTATISDYQLQSYNIQLNKMPPLNMHKIIVISVGDLVTSYKLIEPIVISMFMLDSTTGKIISERWNFIPDSSSRFFNNKAETNKTAAFDITNYESTAVIVAEYFRVLQTDSGDVCNAYLKKGASQSKAVASVNACWPKLKGAYSPFAFSYIQYNNIKGTRCEFPSAIIPDKLLTSDYISAYIAKPKSRADNFPINLSFNVNLLGVNKPSEIPSKYIKIPPLYPLTTQPIIEYRHQLVVNLGQSKFDFPPKVNARNIIASISLLNGSDRLKAIHSKWNEEELVYEEYSRCYYHEKAPLFDDEFVIDLPYPLGSDLMIFIKYFHASTQEKEEAFRPFAISVLPLVINGKFLQDGIKSIGISYNTSIIKYQKPIQSNFQNIQTYLRSTIISNDEDTICLYSKKDNSKIDVSKISNESIIQNLFLVLDTILNNIITLPKESVNNLISLGRLTRTVTSQQLNNMLTIYSSAYAFRNVTEKETLKAHYSIFKYWGEYMILFTQQNQSQRIDIHISSFLFSLIMKSIIISGDTNFNNELNIFSTQFSTSIIELMKESIQDAKILVNSYAEFISLLSTQDFFEAAGTNLMSFIATFMGNISIEVDEISTQFIETALNPKLFIALTFNKMLKSFLQFLIDRAIRTPESKPIQNIFLILAKLFTLIPKNVRSDIANEYIDIISSFNNEMKHNRNQLLTSFTVIAFILRYVNDNEFIQFFNKANQNKLNSFIHFFLQKLKNNPNNDIRNSTTFTLPIPTNITTKRLSSAEAQNNETNNNKRRKFTQMSQNRVSSLFVEKHRVDAASDSKTIIEKYADDILQRSRILRLSPDASAEEIQILSEYNSKNNYTSEALMCQLYQIAIITEYLTILKRMPNAYDLQHPALVFVTLFTEARSAVCPEELLEDLPYINTFCDSSIFSESGLYMVLQDIYTFCKQSRYFELSNEITRVIYPIFEKHKMFAQLGRFFQQSEISYKVIDNMSSSTDRLFGRYYRVSFYGKIFGDEDGKVYIYRETKLAHIFEVSKRIEDSYKALYGEKKIELLQISGFVDRLLLDKNKGYIQITFVEPYFEKEELPQRVTVYEQGNKLKSFKFEAPFVKGERKAQGSVDTQWLRRTILKVNQMMPSLTKRVEVPKEGIIIIEYEPIRVSIRQLKERLNAYKEALEKKDTNAIQPLLHGSLLTTVNEGPVVMAEKFLSTSLRTKYTESMRKKFNLFLEYNKKGLELYNELVKSNPKFKPLQDELEEGFKNLSDKLKPYLENKSIFGK
ncbi:Dedicator of cytokinesis family protein [Histomonas meleagridis]|uniref:Dedicator of cytokinesis family protein n=1 Tax=Histomonas meleagridis TaxID=135588 RepID=UPI00355AABE3|nr:Dedicator of cytokinesis family protein [Histomonas meleagridis]